MTREQMNLINVAVEDTVKAWQDAESPHGTINVDNGNIHTFIKDITETIDYAFKNSLVVKEMEEVESRPVQLNYEEEYHRMGERYKEKAELCEKLNKALINVACQL